MNYLRNLLARFSLRQKIFIAAAAVLVAGGIIGFTQWRREKDFRPLFTNLSPEDAAAVVQKLKESGSEYRISENGMTVLAPSARAPELRLQLAAAGLPKSGRTGFELFDKTNFGLTDFAEHINYRRALEGELERSVMSLAEVQNARVHLTFPKESVFVEVRQPAKASVMVRLKPGAKLAPANVMAVCHLVASAVEGLGPESVSVLDMNGNLLSRPRKSDMNGEQPSEAALEYKQQIEKDLLAKMNGTLEPVLGAEKFRAGLTVECDFSGGEQTDETFDPTRSVMTSSQKTEDISGVNNASGTPGTASSLPRPTSRPGLAGSGTTRRTEAITYQSSRVLRRVRLPQGNIKRISASVLVDQAVRWEGVGPKAKRILEPLAPERLKTVRDVVAAAIGLDTQRGDQLIVETLPFESTLAMEPPPAPPTSPAPAPATRIPMPPWLEKFLAQKYGVPVAAAAGVLLLLMLAGGLWFLMRMQKKKQKQRAAAIAAAALPPPNPVDEAKRELEAKLAEQDALKQRLEAEALHALKIPGAATKKSDVLIKHIGEAVKKDPTAAAQILRTWLYEKGH